MRFNGLIPELSVADIDCSKQFYIDVLGFRLEYERAADRFAFVSLGDAQLMLEQVNGNWNTGELQHPFGRGINLQIAVENVEQMNSRIKNSEIRLFRELSENRYACNGTTYVEKEILVQDPDGYLLRFSQVIAVE